MLIFWTIPRNNSKTVKIVLMFIILDIHIRILFQNSLFTFINKLFNCVYHAYLVQSGKLIILSLIRIYISMQYLDYVYKYCKIQLYNSDQSAASKYIQPWCVFKIRHFLLTDKDQNFFVLWAKYIIWFCSDLIYLTLFL